MHFQSSLSVWVYFWLIFSVDLVKQKNKLKEAAVNKFFASWLRGGCDGIVRGLVPKKPKQYGGLKWESFISRRYAMFFPASWGFSGIRQGFSTDTWPTNYRHAANSRLTVGRQTANSRLTVGRRFLYTAVNDSRPTVGQLSANCWLFFGGAVLHFFPYVCYTKYTGPWCYKLFICLFFSWHP